MIPPECELPDYDEVAVKLFSDANVKMVFGELARGLRNEETNAFDYDRTEVQVSALEVCLKDLPESFQEYVRMDWLQLCDPTWQAEVIEAFQKHDRPVPLLPKPIDRETRISISVDRYITFRTNREGLKRIALSVRRKNASDELLTTISLRAHIGADEQGDLIFRNDELGEALAELTKSDIKNKALRIRECAVCKRIFWAGRIDAQQCGAAKCKTTLSSRLNRNPELRELYNKARRTKRRKQKEAQEKTQSSTKNRK